MGVRRGGLLIGAALATAAITGGIAHADGITLPDLPVTVDAFQTWPPGEGTTTSLHTTSSLLGFFLTTTGTSHWQELGTPAGQFDSSFENHQFNFYPFSYNDDSGVVTDSSGAGLPVGATWDAADFGFFYSPIIGVFDPYEAYSITMPDGMAVQFSEVFGVGYEVATQPGAVDGFLYLFGDFIPIMDIPTG